MLVMVRYKTVVLRPLFQVAYQDNLPLPGSFSNAVHHLQEHDVGLCGIEVRYCNEMTELQAYLPGVLLKVTLCAYHQALS